MIPSRRHRSLTVTSRRKPSRTIQIFSSEVYLRRAAAFTVGTKDLVCSLRSSAASALLCLLLIGTHLLLSVGSSTLISGAHTTLRLSGFPTLMSLSHKPGSVSDIVDKSYLVAITDSTLCVLRQLSSSL